MHFSKHKRFFRFARAVLATAFLAFASATYYLWRQFADTQPSFMDTRLGNVHPLSAQGWTVYLNRAEQFRLYGLAVVAAACLAGAVALDTFVLSKKDYD